MEMSFAELPAFIGRYLLTIELTDFLDIAIMVFVSWCRAPRQPAF